MWAQLCNLMLVWGLDAIGRVIATVSTMIFDEVMGPEPAPDTPHDLGQFVGQVAMRLFGFFT